MRILLPRVRWSSTDRARPDSGRGLAALPPSPILVIERGRGRIEQAVFAAGVERGGGGPSGAWPSGGGDDDAAGLGVEFDLAGESGLFEEGLGDADALRIADGNDAGFDGGARHGRHNVTTGEGASNSGHPAKAEARRAEYARASRRVESVTKTAVFANGDWTRLDRTVWRLVAGKGHPVAVYQTDAQSSSIDTREPRVPPMMRRDTPITRVIAGRGWPVRPFVVPGRVLGKRRQAAALRQSDGGARRRPRAS